MNKKTKNNSKPDNPRKKKVSRIILFYSVTGSITFIVFLMSLFIGSVNIPFTTAVRVMVKSVFGVGDMSDMRPELYDAYVRIINLRLPRTITALCVGASLALSGSVMQGLLKNPLADGSIMGVSSGASVGAVLSIVLGASLPMLYGLGMSLFAIVFAFLSMIAVLALTRLIDKRLSNTSLIIVGVVFSMLAGSVVSFITLYAGDNLRSVVFWSMGSLAAASWPAVFTVLPVLVAGMVWTSFFGRELNALSIGEEEARYLGVKVKSVKLQLLIIVSLLTGISVAISGMIGFAGLIVPHIARKIMGANHKLSLPASLLLGGLFLMSADLLARSLIPPNDLPIGIITSAAGAVFFLVIFVLKRRKRA